jgi:hypothetical protein
MPFQFLSTRLTYDPMAQNVHLAAIADDDVLEVVVSRLVIEHLARTKVSCKDDAFTVVVQHKKELEAAAARALNSREAARRVLVVRIPDLNAMHDTGRKNRALS